MGLRDLVSYLLSHVGSPTVWDRHPAQLRLEWDAPVARGLIAHVPGRPDPARLVMRPALGRDHESIDAVRLRDRAWLGRWEATLPPEAEAPLPSMSQYIRRVDQQQRRREALYMMVELDGAVVGQFALSNVHWGVARMGSLGYWVTSGVAGRGLGATCAAAVIDLAIGELGVHRVEVCVRPENDRSLALCRRLGLYEEGLRPRYLHIAGSWADHVAFSADAESMPQGGYLEALLRSRGGVG